MLPHEPDPHSARRLPATAPLQPYVAEEIEPGPDRVSDEDLLAHHARAHGSTIFHPSGSCTMGPATTPWSWSTPSCACTASRPLRVADASIMPTVASGNTNAACIMIGEKYSDLMLAVR